MLFLQNAGGLWRDEANSVRLSSMPLRELWANLQFDSFPVVWFAVLRGWSACGLGSTDPGLRALGLVVGLAVLAALWRNTRAFGTGPPLVSLALLGFNAAVVGYGDSMRAYGVGMLTGILTFGLVWDLVDRPDTPRLLLASAAALVSVHCVFYNALVLLAACAGGATVAVRRRQWRTIWLLVGLGGLSALSLLLYRGMFEGQRAFSVIIRREIDLAWTWRKFVEATTETTAIAPWLWIVAAGLGLLTATGALRAGEGADRQHDVDLYCGAALLTGVPAYVVFLLHLSYPMQPWYFLVLMALSAACLDGILGRPLQSAPARLTRLGVVCLIVAISCPGVWRAAHQRKTNLDLVAAALQKSVRPGDLVVVNPWYYGVAFDRYYRGPAEWSTLPPLSSHRVHRYDLLKKAMMSPEDVRPLLDRIRDALLAGHAIWWVGDLTAPPQGQSAPDVPPAPNSPWRWDEGPYYRGWSMQAGDVLRRYGRWAVAVPVPSDRPVSRYEHPRVTYISTTASGRPDR